MSATRLCAQFDNLVMNPLKVVGNAVKTMPDNLLNTVDGVVEGFSKVFTKSFRGGEEDEEETMKVSSELDNEVCNRNRNWLIALHTHSYMYPIVQLLQFIHSALTSTFRSIADR